MWTIRQTEAGWEVLNGDTVVGDVHGTYAEALAVIAAALDEQLAVAQHDQLEPGSDGLLPERWESPISTLSEPTGDGRDFTDCEWSWRDPAVSTLPLMLQTCTDMGHFGAELAGYIETIEGGAEGTSGGTRTAGRFYDSTVGRQFRDMLLGGRRFGVSADPGAGTTREFQCTEFDEEDGWCIDGIDVFLTYEVIGITGTPFPGFATAYIQLADSTAVAEPPADAVAAGGGAPARTTVGANPGRLTTATLERTVDPRALQDIPARPPRSWFFTPEPELGQTGMVDVYGMPVEELLVQQDDGSYAVPLTITDSGQFYGHLARWGQCHVGRLDTCIEPPPSPFGYANFHVGSMTLDDGSQLPVGSLVMGMEHPDLALSWVEARDRYAHDGMGWGAARASNGALGAWVAGSLRQGLRVGQVDLLRMLSLSGDWRSIDGGPLDLIGGLSVNIPGFPIAREAIVASGGAAPGTGELRARITGPGAGTPTAIVASGIVTRCPECQRRAALARRQGATPQAGDSETLQLLRVLERRTRHMIPDAVAAAGARVPRR